MKNFVRVFIVPFIVMMVACSCSYAVKAGATVSDDACLPFTMPVTDVLFNSPRKVFAHYFYPFQLSINNKLASEDYYNAQYLNKNGEKDKWLGQGGFLRQRPLAVGTGSDHNWKLVNMKREVRMAIARGITGFTFDVLSIDQAIDPNSNLHLMLKAAQAVDPRFKIVLMPDLMALKSNANAVTRIIASVAASPAAYRLADGRLVVSAFAASVNSPNWWASIISQLKAQNINVAFVPTFLGWARQANAFSSISHGFGDWGTATPIVGTAMKALPAAAHQYGKIFMMPIGPQQYRPKGPIFWEAGNSEAFRNAWMSAILGGADWVQIVTWSDFSESSQIEPYTDATLASDIGTGYYNLNGYYASWFLTGKQPVITHDVLYYFYRREPTNAASPSQNKSIRIVNSKAENNIELVAFLSAPGVLKISIGGQSFTKNAPSGITSFKVPLQPGFPVFTLSRNGKGVISFRGSIQIYGSKGIPSGLLDLTYWSGSASKRGICRLSAIS